MSIFYVCRSFDNPSNLHALAIFSDRLTHFSVRLNAFVQGLERSSYQKLLAGNQARVSRYGCRFSSNRRRSRSSTRSRIL